MSLLKLEKIETGKPVKIYLSGADLLDGTPIIDIKPYLPHIEAKPAERAGFTENCRTQLKVIWQASSLIQCPNLEIQQLIEQSLAQDPRPAHQHERDKIFVMNIEQYEVRFKVCGDTAEILSVY